MRRRLLLTVGVGLLPATAAAAYGLVDWWAPRVIRRLDGLWERAHSPF